MENVFAISCICQQVSGSAVYDAGARHVDACHYGLCGLVQFLSLVFWGYAL